MLCNFLGIGLNWRPSGLQFFRDREDNVRLTNLNICTHVDLPLKILSLIREIKYLNRKELITIPSDVLYS